MKGYAKGIETLEDKEEDIDKEKEEEIGCVGEKTKTFQKPTLEEVTANAK